MGNPENNPEPGSGTAQESQRDINEDDIREDVIDDYDLDPDEDEDAVEKLTQERVTQEKEKSKAIGQKVSWRERAKEAGWEEDDSENTGQNAQSGQGTSGQAGVSDQDIDSIVDQKLQERELENSDLPDDVKDEARKYAKANDVSLGEALESDYVEYQREKVESGERAEKASLGSQKRAETSKNLGGKDMSDFDLSTEEGREEWEEYKKEQGMA